MHGEERPGASSAARRSSVVRSRGPRARSKGRRASSTARRGLRPPRRLRQGGEVDHRQDGRRQPGAPPARGGRRAPSKVVRSASWRRAISRRRGRGRPASSGAGSRRAAGDVVGRARPARAGRGTRAAAGRRRGAGGRRPPGAGWPPGRRRGGGSGRFDPRGERRDRGRLEQIPHPQLDAEGPADAGGELDGDQGVAAQGEEVVADADPLDAEDLLPETGDLPLQPLGGGSKTVARSGREWDAAAGRVSRCLKASGDSRALRRARKAGKSMVETITCGRPDASARRNASKPSAG